MPLRRQLVDRRRLDNLGQFLAPDVVEHAADTVVSVGPSALRQRLAHWFPTVPDAHPVIEDLVVEGDHLVAQLPATDNCASATVFEAWSVRDGRSVERWPHFDRSQSPSEFDRSAVQEVPQ